MLFNSYPFLLLFLPITLAGFFLIGRWGRGFAAGWLALASVFFYGWWDARFVALLLGSIAFNFFAGRILWMLRTSGRATRAALAAAVVANLGLLGYYKYANFFLSTIDAALGGHFGRADIILPLGISFFTFTQIAFLVDTARGQVKEFNFVHYLLFVTYFPHLIAGPILHHSEMMPQFRSASIYRASAESISVGLAYLAIGLFKKCVLADSFSPDVAAAFKAAGQGELLSAPAAWKGAVAYTLQIYFDFSAYSDMAIGLARMFGIRFPLNFDSPYRATSIIDFWRRWHMTLSRFLRDYLYFPLGGNRKGPLRRHVNLMVTMLLGGLWHGASWTFVAWGGLHGIYLVINHAWRALRGDRPATRTAAIAGTALTFFAVIVAWVFFRAPDFPTALRMLTAMAGANGFAPPPVGVLHPAVGALGSWPDALLEVLRYAGALAIVFCLPNTQQIVEPSRFRPAQSLATGTPAIAWRPTAAWGAASALMLAAAMLTFTQVSEFLYFQF